MYSPPNSSTKMPFLPIRRFHRHALVTIFTFLNFCYRTLSYQYLLLKQSNQCLTHVTSKLVLAEETHCLCKSTNNIHIKNMICTAITNIKRFHKCFEDVCDNLLPLLEDRAYGAKSAPSFTAHSAQSFTTFIAPMFFRPLWYEIRLRQLAGFSSRKLQSICMI